MFLAEGPLVNNEKDLFPFYTSLFALLSFSLNVFRSFLFPLFYRILLIAMGDA